MLLIDELSEAEIPIQAVYDISPVAFNGCKVQKRRRKKKKQITKEELNALMNSRKKKSK